MPMPKSLVVLSVVALLTSLGLIPVPWLANVTPFTGRLDSLIVRAMTWYILACDGEN
jgi:hypothetical protein